MGPFAKFNLRVLAGFFGLVLIAAGANGLVDPVNMFDAVKIEGMNANKTRVADPTLRRWKAAELTRNEYQVIYMGSSRTYLGLDPARGFMGSSSVYNAGAGGANFYETYQIFKFIRQTQHPRAIVLGIDFSAFNARKTVSGDFGLSLFAETKTKTYLNYLVSWDMLKLSVKTVEDNLMDRRETHLTPLGFRDLDKQYMNLPFPHHRHTAWSLRRYLRRDELYGDYLYSPERMAMLEQFIDACREDGIELYIFTSPIHAAFHEAMRVVGITYEYESWKRDLARLVDEKNRQYPEQRLAIWDFTGYNSVNTEDIPPESDPSIRMRYQWDGVHFSVLVGTWILEIVTSDGRNRGAAPADFGVKLELDTIEDLLALERERQRNYERDRPEVVEFVEEQARITRRFRPPGAVFLPLRPPREGPAPGRDVNDPRHDSDSNW